MYSYCTKSFLLSYVILHDACTFFLLLASILSCNPVIGCNREQRRFIRLKVFSLPTDVLIFKFA